MLSCAAVFDALDYSVSTNGNERSSAVSVQNLVGDGVTTGGYKISGTNNPQLAFKGVVQTPGINQLNRRNSIT